MSHPQSTVHVVGPNDPIPAEAILVNTTSRSTTWSRALSPFLLGPVRLYDDHVAQNVENAWQYSKVYPAHADPAGEPTAAYFSWAERGWNSVRAHRYPMGKGARPLFSYWAGQKLSYVEARKRIYVPLYAAAVQRTAAFRQLRALHSRGIVLCLWDFDAYAHLALDRTLDQVLHDPSRKMGHAFVLAMLLEGHLPT